MADDTNIDDILKSIDALLKEGEAEDGRDQKDKRRRHEAINDEDVGADTVATPDEMSVEEAVDELQAPRAGQCLDEQRPDDQHGVEHQFGEQHLDEMQQEADAADMDDHPVNLPAEEDAGEKDVQPGAQPAARRIVLSEEMLVEDTPDLPLAFADEDEVDAATDEAEATMMDNDAGTESAHGSTDAVADMAGMDIDGLVEKISAEISDRLQGALPGLVAEAVRRHLAGQAGASGIETGDAADADGD